MSALHVWQQQPNEPNRWYGYFVQYMRAGLRRSLRSTYRDVTCGETPSKSWREAYRRWRWKERAEQWDARQREALLLSYAVTWHDELTRLWGAVDALTRRMESLTAAPLRAEEQNGDASPVALVLPTTEDVAPADTLEGLRTTQTLESDDIRSTDAVPLSPASVEAPALPANTISEQINELWQKYGLDMPRSASVKVTQTIAPSTQPREPAPENTSIADLQWIDELNSK